MTLRSSLQRYRVAEAPGSWRAAEGWGAAPTTRVCSVFLEVAPVRPRLGSSAGEPLKLRLFRETLFQLVAVIGFK